MTYTCLLVDDERPALKLLSAYVDKLPHLDCVDTCENAMQAIAALQKHKVDILFLDIHMPELTGLELLKILKVKPQVILTTAYRDYAVEGFALDVTDYLVKPFSSERFTQAATKAIDRIVLGQKITTASVDQSQTPHVEQDHFFVRTNYKMEKLAFQDILYIKGMREYVSLHTERKRFVVHQTMNKMEEELPRSRFTRVHRSYIVNLSHVTEIKGNTLLVAQEEIPIGGSYKKAFLERLRLL